jgi:sec-independent protein translocase protein TatB
MFDIGFSELLLIALVTLLVMGPERLPQTVRSISLWIGRLKQMLASARHDLEQEVGIDDIRQQLHNEKIMRELNESKEHLEETYSDAFDKTLNKDLDMSLGNPFEEPTIDKDPLANKKVDSND